MVDKTDYQNLKSMILQNRDSLKQSIDDIRLLRKRLSDINECIVNLTDTTSKLSSRLGRDHDDVWRIIGELSDAVKLDLNTIKADGVDG